GFGQEILARLTGKRIHPSWAVPGGVRSPLAADARAELAAALPEHSEAPRRAIELYKTSLRDYDQEVRTFGAFPSYFLGLVGPAGAWENYNGQLRLIDARGDTVESAIEPLAYRDYFGET